jgi:hypothetical protein
MRSDAVGTNEVINGDLNVADLAKASGTVSLNFPEIPANRCVELNAVTPGVDFVGDLLLATPGPNWPGFMTHDALPNHTETVIDIVACNPGSTASNPPATNFTWAILDF